MSTLWQMLLALLLAPLVFTLGLLLLAGVTWVGNAVIDRIDAWLDRMRGP